MAKKKPTPPSDPHTKDIEVGDLVTGYSKGYFRVTQVERRYVVEGTLQYVPYDGAKVGDEYSALIHMRLVMDTKFKEPKKARREVSCDAGYCQKIDAAWIRQKKKELLAAMKRLNEMRDEP